MIVCVEKVSSARLHFQRIAKLSFTPVPSETKVTRSWCLRGSSKGNGEKVNELA